MPKIFVHGLGQTDESWHAVVASLKACDGRCPNLKTFVLCGEKDAANLPASRALYKQLPYAEIFIVPNSKHEVNTDNPQALSKALAQFYNKVK